MNAIKKVKKYTKKIQKIGKINSIKYSMGSMMLINNIIDSTQDKSKFMLAQQILPDVVDAIIKIFNCILFEYDNDVIISEKEEAHNKNFIEHQIRRMSNIGLLNLR